MSVIRINNITNKDGTSGPTISGITTVNSSGFMRVPVGDTRTRIVIPNENIVTDGLVLYLDAGKAESFGGDGTTWRDLSGENNNGTLVNGVGYTVDDGGSLIFDGVDDYISLGIPQLMNGVRVPLTITGWTKSNFFGGNRIIYGVYGYTGSFNSRLYSMIRVDYGVLKYYTSDSGTGFQDFGTFTPSLNVWNFYAVVVSGTLTSPNLQIFLNDQVESFSLGPVTPTPALDVEFRIGGAESNFPEYWNGNISNIMWYNRALTASEVQQNFNALRSRYGI